LACLTKSLNSSLAVSSLLSPNAMACVSSSPSSAIRMSWRWSLLDRKFLKVGCAFISQMSAFLHSLGVACFSGLWSQAAFSIFPLTSFDVSQSIPFPPARAFESPQLFPILISSSGHAGCVEITYPGPFHFSSTCRVSVPPTFSQLSASVETSVILWCFLSRE